MNLFKQAYAAGVKAAKETFTPVAAPKPQGKAPGSRTAMSASQTAALPSNRTSLVAPAAGAGSATNVASAITGAPVMTAGNSLAATPSAVNAARGTAQALAANNPQVALAAMAATNNASTARAVPGAGAATPIEVSGVRPTSVALANTNAPSASNPAAAKMGEFNMGLTPDPIVNPDKVPSPDNGRRMYGTQFSDALRPLRDVDQAFNALNIQKNTDVLNSAGQAEFGAPRG